VGRDGVARVERGVAGDRDEAEIGVLLPVPIGAERGEAAEARLAGGELRGALTHVRVHLLALALQLRVQGHHLVRGEVLRAVEQVALLGEVGVRVAHARKQPLPTHGIGRGRLGQPEAGELAREHAMQRVHGA
jgi:hypothetical protein